MKRPVLNLMSRLSTLLTAGCVATVISCVPGSTSSEVITISNGVETENGSGYLQPLSYLRVASFIGFAQYNGTCIPKTVEFNKTLSAKTARISVKFDNSLCRGRKELGVWEITLNCSDTDLSKAVSQDHFLNVYDLASKVSLLCFKDSTRSMSGSLSFGEAYESLKVNRKVSGNSHKPCTVDRKADEVRVQNCLITDNGTEVRITDVYGRRNSSLFESGQATLNAEAFTYSR